LKSGLVLSQRSTLELAGPQIAAFARGETSCSF
jgi:hypothetical protein